MAALDVGYRYTGASGFALEGFNFDVSNGEIACVTGASATGKSTFGRLLKGLFEPTRGSFTIGSSVDLSRGIDAGERMRLVGWCEAHAEIQLFAATVWDEVAFGARNQGLSGEALDGRVRWALENVGLPPEEFHNRHPYLLSGGERRRLAIAGVIAMEFMVYVFDEPAAGLDEPGCERLMLLSEALANGGSAVVWITHHPDELPRAVKRIWRLPLRKGVGVNSLRDVG